MVCARLHQKSEIYCRFYDNRSFNYFQYIDLNKQEIEKASNFDIDKDVL